MKPKRPTLRDVAREAGVSYQTVSRVINSDMHVSPVTRARVLNTIEMLGYRPNRAAQILQTERSHTLEVIMLFSGFNRFLYEMARAAHDLGYHFVISTISTDEFPAALQSAASRFIDGLLLIPLEPIIDDYEQLIQLTDGVPFVQIGAKLGAAVPSVIYDQTQGARLATQHLIDLGHRSIAEISGPLANYDAYDRHVGWQKTLEENRLAPGVSIESDFNIEGGYQAMRSLLDQRADFTAVFIGNDSMAMGAHTALRERGLRVPDDISLVSFDDIPEAAHFVPGLTTIRQDFDRMGRLATEFLVSMIESPDTPIHQRVLHPRLIVRESTRSIG
ncbi:MAG: LacI family DNA-binding transcriptional regulator [Anaerolineae bacterium]|nr:LacI family DNA-binding transcriptional regulator [Anaerolineae bacterium]